MERRAILGAVRSVYGAERARVGARQRCAPPRCLMLLGAGEHAFWARVWAEELATLPRELQIEPVPVFADAADDYAQPALLAVGALSVDRQNRLRSALRARYIRRLAAARAAHYALDLTTDQCHHAAAVFQRIFDGQHAAPLAAGGDSLLIVPVFAKLTPAQIALYKQLPTEPKQSILHDDCWAKKCPRTVEHVLYEFMTRVTADMPSALHNVRATLAKTGAAPDPTGKVCALCQQPVAASVGASWLKTDATPLADLCHACRVIKPSPLLLSTVESLPLFPS